MPCSASTIVSSSVVVSRASSTEERPGQSMFVSKYENNLASQLPASYQQAARETMTHRRGVHDNHMIRHTITAFQPSKPRHALSRNSGLSASILLVAFSLSRSLSSLSAKNITTDYRYSLSIPRNQIWTQNGISLKDSQPDFGSISLVQTTHLRNRNYSEILFIFYHIRTFRTCFTPVKQLPAVRLFAIRFCHLSLSLPRL